MTSSTPSSARTRKRPRASSACSARTSSPTSSAPETGAAGRDPRLAALPSVDRLLGTAPIRQLVAAHGREETLAALRTVLDETRAALRANPGAPAPSDAALAQRCARSLADRARPGLVPVLNLTGTVLHTNLGRACLPEEAIRAMAVAAAGPCNLELDLDTGRRGERDTHVEALVRELTGAEGACLVNNNAAAVLLVLNTLAYKREVPVSRGELVEIGGSFRLPDVMARAGCRLVEVGTTNRTHPADYAQAVSKRTAALLKVHPSNYAIEGFVAQVPVPALARLAAERGVPLVVDLGSGALLGLERWGLPHEPTVRETLAAGADLVTASGDKLLGGPQAGIVAGRADLVERVRRNPLRRALRADKTTLAALEAVLRLYRNPDALAAKLPTLRYLVRGADDIRAQGERILQRVCAALPHWNVRLEPCASQIGSGALPVDRLSSCCLAIRPAASRRGGVDALARRLRGLPVPVLGRIEDGALRLDLRCLDDEAGLAAQLEALGGEGRGA